MKENLDLNTDEDLLLIYKDKQDQNALAILYKRYMHLVYGLCLKYLKDNAQAEDMVMHIYEKLLKDTLKHDIKHFKSWLYMVSKNHCLMYLRKDQTRTKHEQNYAQEEMVFMESPDVSHLKEENVAEEQLSYLEQCLSELKKEQQACVQLFYIENKCYNEIAEKTGFILKKVKSYIQNGKRNLKICIEKKHAEQVV